MPGDSGWVICLKSSFLTCSTQWKIIHTSIILSTGNISFGFAGAPQQVSAGRQTQDSQWLTVNSSDYHLDYSYINTDCLLGSLQFWRAPPSGYVSKKKKKNQWLQCIFEKKQGLRKDIWQNVMINISVKKLFGVLQHIPAIWPRYNCERKNKPGPTSNKLQHKTL